MEVVKVKFKGRTFDANWTLKEANLMKQITDYSQFVDILNSKLLSGEAVTDENFTELDFFKFITARMTAISSFLVKK